MTQDERKNPPPARGVRQDWADIPQKMRDLVEQQIGGGVIKAETQHGGFSPGVALRLYTADDQIFFLKAIGTDINATSISFHRKEAKLNAQLPDNTFAPKMLWSHDDADDTGWIALLFENIDGVNPPTPWQDDDLQRVMRGMVQLSEQLTPSPIVGDFMPSASDHFRVRIHGWQTIKSEPNYVNRLDDWSQSHLDKLCDLEQKAPESVAGDTLVHFDVRADNMVMTDDAVWFVDWPHACIGAKWLDTVLFAPSVVMQGGLSPEDLIQLHPACQEADPDAITAAVVSVAGMLTYRSLQPSPTGLPTLREFQSAMAEVTRQWVAQRTGWQ
ncbi:MAG: phosphotransferase [Chloroflexota bacterium]